MLHHNRYLPKFGCNNSHPNCDLNNMLSANVEQPVLRTERRMAMYSLRIYIHDLHIVDMPLERQLLLRDYNHCHNSPQQVLRQRK
jgi:hypothetical protein